MLSDLFATTAVKVATAIIAGLLVLLLIFWIGWDNAADTRDNLRNELGAEEARHAVTRQSVDTLTLEMKRLVEEGEARAERVDEAMQQVAEDTAPLKAEAERIEREGLPADYVEQLQEAGL